MHYQHKEDKIKCGPPAQEAMKDKVSGSSQNRAGKKQVAEGTN